MVLNVKSVIAAALVFGALAPQAEASWFSLPRSLKPQMNFVAFQETSLVPLIYLQSRRLATRQKSAAKTESTKIVVFEAQNHALTLAL